MALGRGRLKNLVFLKSVGRSLGIKRFTSFLLVVMGRIISCSGIPVLLYHSVDDSGSVISITPADFTCHMYFLRNHGYKAISLKEFVRRVAYGRNRLSEKMFVLTFDDGFKNNYTEVFPILQECGFTATIFVPTDHVGGTFCWDGHTSIPDLSLLSWHEIEEMSRWGIEFGSHGCSHAHLTRMPSNQVWSELSESKSQLEQRLQKPVCFFCHPYGEFNETTQQLAKKCGYYGAFGSLDYSLGNRQADLFNLKRVGTAHFSSVEDLEAGLLGTYFWYLKIKSLSG